MLELKTPPDNNRPILFHYSEKSGLPLAATIPSEKGWPEALFLLESQGFTAEPGEVEPRSTCTVVHFANLRPLRGFAAVKARLRSSLAWAGEALLDLSERL